MHLDFLQFKFLHEGWKSPKVQNFMLFTISFSIYLGSSGSGGNALPFVSLKIIISQPSADRRV